MASSRAARSGGTVSCTNRETFTVKPGCNIASDSTNVYFCAPEEGLILRAALAGGAASQYASAQSTTGALGALRFMSLTGSGQRVTYVDLGASSKPMRLVRDKGFLYFTHNTAPYRVALP